MKIRNPFKAILIIIILVMVAISSVVYNRHVYYNGWENGADFGYTAALDTVKKIIEKELKSDRRMITEIEIVGTDTCKYYLSKKNLPKNQHNELRKTKRN